MSTFGSLDRLAGIGNSGSYRHALSRMAQADEDPEVVGYLCEDDYLHHPDALRVLEAIGPHLTLGTYVTLYDHPDRYRRDDDLRTLGRPVEFWDGRHWGAVESTAMTFGTSMATFRADQPLLDLAARFTRYPHDRAIWRTLQGLGLCRPVTWARSPRRRLLSALPGLATHMETDALGPGTDWAAVACQARRWAAERSLPGIEGW